MISGWLAPVLILGVTIFDTTLVTISRAGADCFPSPRQVKITPLIV